VPGVEKANLDELEAFITRDGSSIRELAGPAWTAARNQSLAEATVAAGGETHKLWNPGPEPLVLLCCCAPAYRDDDTVMTGR
jgi:hypothetical protein